MCIAAGLYDVPSRVLVRSRSRPCATVLSMPFRLFVHSKCVCVPSYWSATLNEIGAEKTSLFADRWQTRGGYTVRCICDLGHGRPVR